MLSQANFNPISLENTTLKCFNQNCIKIKKIKLKIPQTMPHKSQTKLMHTTKIRTTLPPITLVYERAFVNLYN